MARDKDKWRAVENTEINLRFYKLQKISSPDKEPLASQKNLPYEVSQSVRSL